MKIIIKIIILYYYIQLYFNLRSNERRRYCNNIKQDFTIFYVQIIIFEYRYVCCWNILLLPYNLTWNTQRTKM